MIRYSLQKNPDAIILIASGFASELVRSGMFAFPKKAYKIVDVVETALVCNDSNRKSCVYKKRLCFCEPDIGQILLGAVACLLFKAAGKILRTDEIVIGNF